MATRVSFENSNDIGVFAKLTNAYCLCAVGAAENFYRLCNGRVTPGSDYEAATNGLSWVQCVRG